MKIKNLLLITIVTFVITLLIINLSIFYTNQRLVEISNQLNTSEEIEAHISHLNQIINNYFLYQNDVDLDNWQSNITEINNLLSELDLPTDQQSTVYLLLEETGTTDTNFNKTVEHLQNTARNSSVRDNPEFQLIWNEITNDIEKLDADQSHLSSSLLNQSNQVQTINISLIAISLLTFGLYLVVNYFISYRRTLQSISNLQKGIGIIGSGNLDYSLKTDENNELGQLAESINNMVKHLKSLTVQLRNQERMAAIGQTAGMVGHDLRNPLQTITGEIYLAKSELQKLSPGNQKNNLIESINAIDEQISYMDKIVSDLQTFIKPVEVHKVTFNAKQFIADRLTESHIPNTIKTELHIENELKIYADEQLTKRVLINLLTNSLQAMPNGGQLTIKAQTKNSRVLISVEDTGVGIPEEVKPKLFTPLFTTKSRGQGFGLAVCKRVIEAQGGTISFESEAGKGAKFTIELPKD